MTDPGPSGPGTISAAAARARDDFAELIAFMEDGQEFSFRQFVTAADRVAAMLRLSGVDRGDRVAIWAPNSTAWAVAGLGIHLLGAVLVPVNTRFVAREAAAVLREAGARLVFVTDDFLGRDFEAELVAELGPESSLHLHRLPDRHDLERWVGDLPAAISLPELSPDDPATVLFTSGTTGKPKGIVLRHGALARGYGTWSELTGLRRGDRIMATNPFFHAFGLNVCLLGGLIHGATVVPMPVFEAEKVQDAIERLRITYYPAPPTVFADLLRLQGSRPRDLSSLRVCVTGATTIEPGLILGVKAVLGFEQVFVPYGFTEATGLATLTRADDDLATVATTAGRPVPDVDVTVRRPDGSACEPEETGEIFVGGYVVMAGYLTGDDGIEAPELRDGAIASGDLGHFNHEGNLVISGRKNDMIVTGGFNVFPVEVENTLRHHPNVRDVSVIAIKDDRMGEVGCAVVVSTDETRFDPAELKTWARSNMANYKAPRQFVSVAELPRNASGKVSKLDLQALVATRTTAESDVADISRTGAPNRGTNN